jgi:hypothetical protein
VNYAKISIRDALAAKRRTHPHLHASFSIAPRKKMSAVVSSARIIPAI